MHISKWLLSATEFHGIGHCFKPNMKFRDKGKGKGGEGLEKGGRKGWGRAGRWGEGGHGGGHQRIEGSKATVGHS